MSERRAESVAADLYQAALDLQAGSLDFSTLSPDEQEQAIDYLLDQHAPIETGSQSERDKALSRAALSMTLKIARGLGNLDTIELHDET